MFSDCNYRMFFSSSSFVGSRNRLTTAAPFSPSIEITSRLFAVSNDAKHIYSGAHWDYSLRIYSVLKSKTIASMVRHTDVITCLALDSTGYILVTGSRDTTCVVWYLSSHDPDSTMLMSAELTIYGHTAEVTCVSVSSELDLVVSGSTDGTCNMHTIEHGTYVRTLRPTNDQHDPIVNLKLSTERHLLVQTEREETHLFLYSINGCLIRTRKFEFRIAGMLLHDHYIVLAVNHESSLEPKRGVRSDEATPSLAARIIIKDMFE